MRVSFRWFGTTRITPFDGEGNVTERQFDALGQETRRIRDTAVAMREALVGGDWDAVGRAIAQEWDNRKRLAPGVTTPAIETLIARAIAAGATAAKVCGAGGGGSAATASANSRALSTAVAA